MIRHIRNVIRGGEGASPLEARLHSIYFAFFLTLIGVGVGLLALAISACSLTGKDYGDVFLSYFRFPLVVVLNLLPPVLLIWLGYFLFRRAWAAYLLCAVVGLLPAVVNHYKIQLRGDPFLATDLRLVRTARGIIGSYTLDLTLIVIYTMIIFAALLIFTLVFMPNGPGGKKLRVGGALACLALMPLLYAGLYQNETIYNGTFNDELGGNEWSELDNYVCRGFWYPFVRSMKNALPSVPKGYNVREAESTLARYAAADISPERKVNVVAVMLEAFSDLSDYPMLADLDGVSAVYEPLHELESRSVSGDLLTNIFAGGTVDSEWGFLSGYSHHDEFRAGVDSYVRYFNAQGYDTYYRHPGYSWFYNRENVNRFLGFDESVFTENGFGDYVKIESAPWHSDKQLFDFLLRDLDARTAESAPLFDFAMSYQNHGPYDATRTDTPVIDAGVPWSEESCGILDHYLTGVADTISELRRFTDELEKRDIPVVFVVYGDHKPWLGNNNSVYNELGVSLEPDTVEGLYNYYSTPYLIWANSAAKDVLGGDFTGSGGDFSPCFLMSELFDLCSWDGPAFMAMQREMRAYTPMLHDQGLFLENGVLTETLSPEADAFYRQYRCVEYWRETRGLTNG